MLRYKNDVAILSRSLRLSSLIILLALALGLSWPPAARADEPYLQWVRERHTTTVLNNGQVLIVGGYGCPSDNPNNIPNGVLSVVELCDQDKGVFSYTQNLWYYRENHTATRLKNGKVLVAGGDDGYNAWGTVELYDPASGTWSLLGSLQTPRTEHTATLLGDGTILLAGGRNDYGLLTYSEIYNPNTGTSRMVYHSGRTNHTATLLPNGQVLVAGGEDANGYLMNTAEIYDPVTGIWYWTGSNSGKMNYYRACHTATLMNNGQVLVAAGYDGANNNSSELFDPASGTWTPTRDQSGNQTLINVRTCYHSATLLPSGQVLLTGGLRDAGYEALTEIYDPNSQKWTDGNLLLNGRAGHTASLLASGNILLIGGYNSVYNSLMGAELFYPNLGQWLPVDPITYERLKPRTFHTATLLPSNQVLVTGGFDSVGPMSSTQLLGFDPSTQLISWNDTASLTPARYSHTATLLPCGLVLVAGGMGATSVLPNAQLYDPAKGTWRPTQALKQDRWMHSATLLKDGTVLVSGGADNAGNLLASTELYNPATGAWKLVGSMNFARFGHTATLLKDGRVLVTGAGNGKSLPVAELYDPASQTWSTIGQPMVTPRVCHTATLLSNDLVLVAGGFDTSGNVLNTAELFDPVKGIWTPTKNNLHFPRGFHSATLLPNGLVMAAGGRSTSLTKSFSPAYAELYDPALGIWIMTYYSGMMNVQRELHTATLLNDGSVLVAGGDNGTAALGAVELYENWFGLPLDQRKLITEVKIMSPPAGYQRGPDSTDSDIWVGITLSNIMSQYTKEQQSQVQLLSFENKFTYTPTIVDTPQSTKTFLVVRVPGAAKDIYQVTVSLGGIPSLALTLRFPPNVVPVPPCLNNTSCLQMLLD